MTISKLNKTYHNKFIEASILGDMIASGQVVRKDQTPLMKMLALETTRQRMIANFKASR